MKRAIHRNVEKLGREQLIKEYDTYYYPAQRYHFERDQPLLQADCIYCNE